MGDVDKRLLLLCTLFCCVFIAVDVSDLLVDAQIRRALHGRGDDCNGGNVDLEGLFRLRQELILRQVHLLGLKFGEHLIRERLKIRRPMVHADDKMSIRGQTQWKVIQVNLGEVCPCLLNIEN